MSNGNATALATEQTLRRVRTENEPDLTPPPAIAKPETTQRLLSLDAYRGLIMVTLAFTGFGLAGTAQEHLKLDSSSAFWQIVYHNFEHVNWVGCGYWDLIQPSFMFMVGVAMAFSYAKRRQTGQPYLAMLGHAVLRSLVLIFLGIYFSARWELMNVLTQIGLGYTFLFLLWGRSARFQAVAAVVVLAGTWLLYDLYPFSGVNLDDTFVDKKGIVMLRNGVPKAWALEYLSDVGPSWQKNANVGHAIDLVVLNRLPLDRPFEFNNGGYQTINFLPSLATMLFGLMCGELLRGRRSNRNKLLILFLAGLAGLAVGELLGVTGICPLVKRIWTPSWAIFSTGWCCLILMSLYGIIDVLGYRRWAFPLVVVGMNSIAIYFMGQTLRGHTNRFWHGVASDWFVQVGPLWAPMLEATLTGLLFWLVCLWLYRQRIFVRI
jgi:heparan-alpha-glucosaminide N-acetyltransferase